MKKTSSTQSARKWVPMDKGSKTSKITDNKQGSEMAYDSSMIAWIGMLRVCGIQVKNVKLIIWAIQ